MEFLSVLISQSSSSGLSDELLLEIANSICDESKITALGFKLGFEYADIDRALKTNRVDGQVTSKGTHRMLHDWKEQTTMVEQRTKLKEALEKSGLAEVAEKLLQECK